MYCLDAFKSLIKEKRKRKHGSCTPARLSVLTKTTLMSIHGLQCAPQYYSSALQATRLTFKEHKRPSDLCRIPHDTYRKC